ncbi:MAG TPA: ABC transporter substrate-binding protein [Xanthobacteraceae bacterium]|nr:ABC transporter substrate-binding protein [Xanthobacteraceae bacterium]
MTHIARIGLGLGLGLLAFAASAARAEDLIKIAIGQRGVFENSISELGQNRGFFKKYGIKLDILYTQGGGETLQAILSDSVQMGIVGTLQTMGAYAKGAPIRAIGATMKGAYEYWFVPSASPIKNFKDTAGKTVAFSTTNSSNNLMVLALARLNHVTVEPVATGSPSPTYTMTMSKQVDVGWSIPPFHIEDLDSGKIRIIAHGSDVPEYANQTVRFLGVNATELQQHPDLFRRYMQGYRDALNWLYSDPQALKDYAVWADTTEAVAKRVRDEFVLRENALPDNIVGLDLAMADAIGFKILSKPLTADQLKDMIRLQEPIK